MKNESTSIRLANPEELDRLEDLWKALYEHQTNHGMQIQLPRDASFAWVAGIAPLLGRFAFVVAAEEHGVFVGFVAGRSGCSRHTSASNGWASSAKSSSRRRGARSVSARDFSREQSNGIARTTSTGSSCRSWQTIRMGCGSTNGLDGGRSWCS